MLLLAKLMSSHDILQIYSDVPLPQQLISVITNAIAPLQLPAPLRTVSVCLTPFA